MSAAVMVLAALLQDARFPESPWDMVTGATPATKIVLLVLLVFSLLSWVLIFWKWTEFRRVREEGDSFVREMESSAGLADVYGALRGLDESPYTRVFRQGVNFFTELRPRALTEPADASHGLSSTQLDTLWLVLEKGLAQERDDLSHGLTWLAIIGSVSPLLGLMGTVIGVMNSFIGITARGSSSIAAVAPGIAEALITTVVGLAVAIPAVIAYNHYAAKLGLFTSELEGFASEFVGTLAREGWL
ncbi:MAG: MotA/TolQ/ExbB proton channel family protein [Gemmatimonadetes bacterium]|nr:MotA/TolQ/ExbB proton channel family protein [Gemmatimonadota bacterium]